MKLMTILKRGLGGRFECGNSYGRYYSKKTKVLSAYEEMIFAKLMKILTDFPIAWENNDMFRMRIETKEKLIDSPYKGNKTNIECAELSRRCAFMGG